MSDTPGTVTAEFDGFEISSNSGATAEEITENLESSRPPAEEEEIDPSRAAAALGKKGGEASAAKRKADADAAAKAAKTSPAEELDEEDADVGDREHSTPHPKSARGRMLKATREAKEAREEAARARADAAQAKADAERYVRELHSARNPDTAARPREVDPRAPNPDNFKTWDEYFEAHTDYKVAKALAERDARDGYFHAEAEREIKVKEILREGGNAHKEFIEARPTFYDEVSPEVLDLKPSMTLPDGAELTPENVLADEIILAKSAGPLVMLHLTDHPDELERLLSLRTPLELQIEMRMLAKSLGSTAAPAKAVAAAPKVKPPIKPLAGSPHEAEPSLTEEMSLDEYVPRANARDRARR